MTILATGIDELPTWSVAIDPHGKVAVPPSLATGDASTSGRIPPTDEWSQFELAGIVAERDADITHAQIVAELARHSVQSLWPDLLDGLAQAGRLLAATDQATTRGHIMTLFSTAHDDAL